ncbi:hypothetical protein [Halotalea alkalilenta]|uniref:Uncharacterized protein n=1 Tax=Halotalea alkalilenta TaxID=376489 RepID=A0A172YA94_9GAMM|nr:hypothetical protein [Halotalea alkalilenta]ANF56052.1 hypothetical protein A5892_00030 [Halotalea alkalilenta]
MIEFLREEIGAIEVAESDINQLPLVTAKRAAAAGASSMTWYNHALFAGEVAQRVGMRRFRIRFS